MKNKFLTLMLSLLISFGLWMYVVTVISPESEATVYDIPVELVGNDYLNHQNLIVVSTSENLRVNLTLGGNRSDLKKLNNSNITVIADLSKITYAGEHRLDCSVSFGSGAVEVLAQDPDYITVVVAEKLTKTVPVRVNFIGAVPDGYEEVRDNVSMDHTTVTISGPKDTIDKIAYASITVDLSGQMTTFVDDYTMILCGADTRPIADLSFVTANVSHIRAVVQVNKVKKVSLQFIRDYSESGLLEDMVTLYPTVETVTLVGSSDALERVDDTMVFTIVLSQYSETSTETFVPVLPEGVECVEDIMVHIQIPEMGKRSLTVSQFTFENVPDGINPQVTGTTTVEIRGPLYILENLTAEQVFGVVDCTAVSGTNGFAPVRYVIPDYDYLYVLLDWNNGFIAVQNAEG